MHQRPMFQTLDCSYRDARLLDRLPGDLDAACAVADGPAPWLGEDGTGTPPEPFLAAFPVISDAEVRAEYERRRSLGLRDDPRTETWSLNAVLWWLRSENRSWTLRGVDVRPGGRVALAFDCDEDLAFFGVIRQVLRAYGVEIGE